MKKSYIVASLCIIFFLSLFVFHKINLTTADLGRHIENGKLFVHAGSAGISRPALLHTNFFSYTNADFPFVNHHWGSGVLYYVIHYVTGFWGLSLVYGGCIILATLVLLYIFREKVPLLASVPIILFLTPLITERTEVRPEGFSYLFLAIIIALLYSYSKGSLEKKWLWAIPIISLLFVNMHIYFIFVPFIVGMFLLEALIRKDFGKSKTIGIVLGVSSLALLLNPYGLSGVLYPFTIFQNYGYLVVENQSIHFLANYGISNPNFLWWKISTTILLGVGLFILLKHRSKFPFSLFGIAAAFAVLSYLGIRHLSLYGLALLPFFLHYAEVLYRKPDDTEKRENHMIVSVILSIFFLIVILVQFGTHMPWGSDWGVGLKQGVNASAEFFEKEKIEGPIFSNYDIGGYLIFHLYPQEKVFVDNRPEAYPAKFFENEYKRMQEDHTIWDNELKKWDFNTIFFYRHDLTPWAQKFLIARIWDPEWAPVFVDDYTIIFLRRNEESKDIIKKYELPKSMFSVK